MSRRKLIIATRNAHKVQEIRAILGDSFEYLTLNNFTGVPKVIEDADTFAGNATRKAVQISEWLTQSSQGSLADAAFVLADDSGLEVDALAGAPGVHSARFAAMENTLSPAMAKDAPNTADAANNARLLRLLRSVPLQQRTARFRCVLALAPVLQSQMESSSPVCLAGEAELQCQLFEGTCEGHISYSPAGYNGFGYDPLFLPNGYTQSFAELGESVKNGISHRARALQKLKVWFENA